MTPEKWKHVKQILETALELPKNERGPFLEEQCGGDAQLRSEIESLLTADNTRANLLESDAASNVFAADSGGGRIGDRVGPYEITGELGTGGMGAVFLARRADGAFDQTVALKLIKRGMDSDAILKRFVNERQILASLEHPNIARLIDGGTTDDGLPYFVMECVEGESITTYAERKNLALGERLDLFRDVCAAVSFAHQNLVIHRDLKPSNILITNDGKVNLLDFGIAKLLKTDDDLPTATHNFVFTPEYASPEQVRGQQLTTATDIYSLGVILYELLSGTRPYRTEDRNISEIIKAVCETEPAAPSRGWRDSTSDPNTNANGAATDPSSPATRSVAPSQLRGDLDNIVLKALRKEPERRYSSVEQFSEDIRRHQAGLPVTAVRDTWGYRASKYARRHRIGVAAAALILIVLSAGLFATLYQRNRAQRRFNDVRQIANSFLFEFHDAIEKIPGTTPARELVVKRALEYLDQLAADSSGDDVLLRELATAYEKVGKIQGNSYNSNLGDTEGAVKSYNRSLEMRLDAIKRDPNNLELRHELANAYEGVGDMHYTVAELEPAAESYRKSLELRKTVQQEAPGELKYVQSLAETHRRLGDVTGLEGYPNLGDIIGSIENYRRAVELGERLIAAEPDNPSYQNSYAVWTINLAMLETAVGDTANAIKHGRTALALNERIVAANPDNEPYKLNMLSAFNVLRYPLTDEMLFDEAASYQSRAITALEEMSKADPKNSFLKRSLGVSINGLGRLKVEAGRPTEAIANHRTVLKMVDDLAAADPESKEHVRDRALTLEFLGNAEARSGDCTAAIASYGEALKFYSAQKGEGDDLSGLYSAMAKCYASLGRLAKAADTAREAVRLAEMTVTKSPHNARKQSRAAICYFDAGKILTARAAQLKDAEKDAAIAQAKDLLGRSAKIFGELQAAGKLSKINAGYPAAVAGEMAKL